MKWGRREMADRKAQILHRDRRIQLCSPPDAISRQHTSAYVSIRQHTSAYVSIRQHTSSYISIRQHTSACVSIRQHTSACEEVDLKAFFFWPP